MSFRTPGPWTVDGVRIVTENEGELVGTCESEVPGDARLIAAAPDLLNALKAALAELDGDSIGAVVDVLESQGRAAIAKAEGS